MSGLPAPPTPPDCGLIGRQLLFNEIFGHARQGRHLFALEGVTGVGKSALLEVVSTELEKLDLGGITALNAAQLTSEELAIAAIYVRLKGLARDPEAVVAEIKKQFTDNLPHVLRKLAAAAAADLVKVVAEKAEKTIEAAKEILTGEAGGDSVGTMLDSLDGANRRFFLIRFLQALEDAGNPVVIAIDNFDGADPSLTEFVRFLVKSKPPNTIVAIAHNTEVGNNLHWDYVVADIEARGGAAYKLDVFEGPVIAEWFHRDIGRWPSGIELAALTASTGGRAYNVKQAIEAIRDGGADPVSGNYRGYYELKRRALAIEARAVAELLAVMNYDAGVARDSLAVAAQQLGVADIGPALDELRAERLLKEVGVFVGLVHRLAQDTWREAITGPRRTTLAAAWYETIRQLDAQQLTEPGITALIPVVVTPLIEAKSLDEVAEIGACLIAAGQIQTGLELLDHTWKFGAVDSRGGADMLQHALLAARTRLALGRYQEVDEPLTQAALVAQERGPKLEILLLRMKLALRRNTYPLLWTLAESLEELAADDVDAKVEGQQILNVAYRDLLDYAGIKRSSDALLALRNFVNATTRMSMDRALARALAKLGDTEAASQSAESALSASQEVGSVRDIGNAHLARAETARYRGDFGAALVDYRKAEEIARGTGNRDSQLWALLGEAAAHIESAQRDRAKAPLDQVAALLAEPGYEHPLEAAHATMLRVFAGLDQKPAAEVLAPYEALGVAWPAAYLQSFLEKGMVAGTTPI